MSAILAVGMLGLLPVPAQASSSDDVLSAPSSPAQTSEDPYLWIHEFGSSIDDLASGVAVDASGVYVSGSTAGTLPGQTTAGSVDAYLSKYDANGNALWVRQFGTSSSDVAYGVAVDASGIYVVGDTVGTLTGQSLGLYDAFVRKYDANGNELWTRQFGTSSSDHAYAVSADASGVYIAGSMAEDTFVAKYDPSGNEVWTRRSGTAYADAARGVAVSGSNVYVVGTLGDEAFVRGYNSGGTLLWTHLLASAASANAVAVDASGMYAAGYIGGTFPGQTSAGLRDAFVVKSDLGGNLLWLRQFGTAGMDGAYGIAADASGVYAVGNTFGAFSGQASSGGGDVFVRKYDGEGNEVWTRQFGTDANDWASGVGLDESGAYIAGDTPGVFAGQASAGLDEAFVAKVALDKTGPLLATLLGRDAWPARHNLAVSKYGADQTLYGRMENVGPGAVAAKVVFTITNASGLVVARVHSNVAEISIGAKTTVQATWTAQPGAYDVTAQCWYDSDGDGSFDGRSPAVRVFSFKVVP